MSEPGNAVGSSAEGPGAPISGIHFVENLVGFGSTLRAVGIPVSPSQSADAARALSWVDLGRRAQVFRALRALMVTRREDLALFEATFNWFWRPPQTRADGAPWRPPVPRSKHRQDRFTIATYAAFKARTVDATHDILDRSGTASDLETLQRKRFAAMSPEELEETRKLLERLDWSASVRITRRRTPHRSGAEIDLRRVLKEASRMGSLPPRLPRRRRSERDRPVVLLADISGSMEDHSRLILHFFHVLIRRLSEVETFVFGTRLSRITPQLRLRNVDRAIDQAASEVLDWAGGTRIGACLGEFNRRWGKRVLRRGALVVVVSDGCDGGDLDELRRELQYLQRRCHRLIWLNPHMGHSQYSPRVAGMKAALPYTDDFLPVDNVESLLGFADALADLGKTAGGGRARRWRGRSDSTPHWVAPNGPQS